LRCALRPHTRYPAFHQPQRLRFRSPNSRGASLSTRTGPLDRFRPPFSALAIPGPPRTGLRPWGGLAYASASSARIEVCCPTPVFHVRPFASCWRLLWPRLTSGDSSQRLSTPVAQGQTARPPRVLRTHLHAYACRIYVTAFRASTGLCVYVPAHPTVPPLSASCSSGQRFACGFLRIPPRDGHPSRSANTSPCRVCRGLSPPSKCALPGAHAKKPGAKPGFFACLELPVAGTTWLPSSQEPSSLLPSLPVPSWPQPSWLLPSSPEPSLQELSSLLPSWRAPSLLPS
jgi:hypothetical protein